MQGNPTPTPESIGLITGPTGLALLATATQAEARESIGVERGTWLPSYSLGTSGSVTMGTRRGNYIKIGDWVWFNLEMDTASISSPNGLIFIPLPFPPAAQTATAPGGGNVTIGLMFSWGASLSSVPTATIGGLGIVFYKNQPNSVNTAAIGADMSSASGGNFLLASGSYQTE